MCEIAKTFEKFKRISHKKLTSTQHILWHEEAIIEARFWYKEAIKQDPSHPLFRYRFGRMLVKHTHMYGQAIEQLMMAMELLSGRPSRCHSENEKIYDHAKR